MSKNATTIACWTKSARDRDNVLFRVSYIGCAKSAVYALEKSTRFTKSDERINRINFIRRGHSADRYQRNKRQNQKERE